MKKQIEFLVNNVQNNAHTSYFVEGLEALTIGESFGLYFREFNLSIDKVFNNIVNDSVHVVDDFKVRNLIENKKIDYIKNMSNPITIPYFFSPKNISFTEYNNLIIKGMVLFNMLKSDSETIYNYLKSIVSTNKVPQSLPRWKISNTDKLIDELEKFINGLIKSGSNTLVLNSVYPNLSTFLDTTYRFNQEAKDIRGRDTEIVRKQLNQVYSIANTLLSKEENKDITFTSDELSLIKTTFSGFTRAVNVAGTMMSLVNEQSKVLKLQAEEISNFK